MCQKKAKKGCVNGTVNKLSIECGKADGLPEPGTIGGRLRWQLRSASTTFSRGGRIPGLSGITGSMMRLIGRFSEPAVTVAKTNVKR